MVRMRKCALTCAPRLVGRSGGGWSVLGFQVQAPRARGSSLLRAHGDGRRDKIVKRKVDPPKRDERGGRISEMSDNSEAIRLDATKKEIAAQGIQQDRPKVNRIASTKKISKREREGGGRGTYVESESA